MKATLIAGFVLLAFVSKAVAQDELYLENRPYLDFNQFQALVNVNDLSYMENLGAYIQRLTNWKMTGLQPTLGTQPEHHLPSCPTSASIAWT
ncbi:MAG: hypothetical protein OXF20_01740 [Gammaproteobacteria bacterium]|nr:hypothetical protein [Gammaproteobacteria bacterium]